MTDLVACLSSGKGTWGHVARLIQDPGFENVYLIVDSFSKENFKVERQNVHLIVVDPEKPLSLLVEDVKNQLKGKLKGFDVAINMISGSGKEHMAMLSAVIGLGFGIRFVALTQEGIKEI
jgi:hypothetical protein